MFFWISIMSTLFSNLEKICIIYDAAEQQIQGFTFSSIKISFQHQSDKTFTKIKFQRLLKIAFIILQLFLYNNICLTQWLISLPKFSTIHKMSWGQQSSQIYSQHQYHNRCSGDVGWNKAKNWELIVLKEIDQGAIESEVEGLEGWVAVFQLLCRFWLFCDSMDCSPPGSSVLGISQARITEGTVFGHELSLISFICTVNVPGPEGCADTEDPELVGIQALQLRDRGRHAKSWWGQNNKAETRAQRKKLFILLMLEGRKRSREKVQDHEDSLRGEQRERAVIGTEAGIQGREVGLENNTLMDIKGRCILPHHPHAHKAHT